MGFFLFRDDRTPRYKYRIFYTKKSTNLEFVGEIQNIRPFSKRFRTEYIGRVIVWGSLTFS